MKILLGLFISVHFLILPVLHSQTSSTCSDKPGQFPIQVTHLSPICQGQTNTCWAFSTLSFLESEVIRQTGRKIRLSPMWIVYYAYLEKACNYYKKYGKARLNGGGLSHDVLAIIQKYGVVRYEDYPGKIDSTIPYNHRQLDLAVQNLMRSLVKMEDIALEFALLELKEILNHHLGVPPETLRIDEKQLTPQQFVNDILKLQPDAYIQITSFLNMPFFTKGELILPDNWKHYNRYLNVPIAMFPDLIEHALKAGYSVVIDMDLTEATYRKKESSATLTTAYDSLNQSLRETWFRQAITTDDHLQHLVGYAPCTQKNGYHWYLVKDSLPASINSPSKGYIYMREDYLKMKVLSFMVHRDAVKDRLQDHFSTIFH